MKTLVMYGEAFGAETMVPVTSNTITLSHHSRASVIAPVYDLMEQLIGGGGIVKQRFFRRPAVLDRMYRQISCRS